MESLIALGAFALATAVIAWRARGSTLSQLPLLPGESILFDEDGIEVTQDSRREVRYPRCRVRVTTQRVIVAQKILRRDDHALRFVFHVPSSGPTSLKGVYVTSHLQPQQIRLDLDHSRIEMPLGSSALTQNQTVRFQTRRPEDWRARLRA